MADTDSLDWVRLDTNMHVQPKILRLVSQPSGGAAAFAWVCSITHSGLVTSNGRISPETLPLIHATKKVAELLVKEKLWDLDPAGSGWVVHDYQKYNQTRETSQTIRITKKIGGIRGNHAKHKHEESGVSCDCQAKIDALTADLPPGFTGLA
jgi:hypothetical protein